MGLEFVEVVNETGSIWLAASAVFALAAGWALLRATRAGRDQTENKG